jgi:hypothetical protein
MARQQERGKRRSGLENNVGGGNREEERWGHRFDQPLPDRIGNGYHGKTIHKNMKETGLREANSR